MTRPETGVPTPGYMDRFWSQEGLAARARVQAFAESELGRGFEAHESAGTFARDDWDTCARFGLLRLCVPEEYGGTGGDIAMGVMSMEGLGRGCRDNGLTLAINGQMWTTMRSILECGSEEQKRRWLPGLCDGSLIAAQSLTEPDTGSDVFSLKTRAERTDRGYALTGDKCLVTLAPEADRFLVFATVNPDRGRWGVTAFYVDRDTPGLAVGTTEAKMGLRTAPLGRLHFDQCEVPESARLGAEGSGVAISQASLEWERSCMLASQIGILERQIDTAVSYARDRHQFGQPIGRFQSVANRIADMKVRLESSRLLVYRVAALKMQGRAAAMEAAMAKLCLGEALVASGLDLIRTHGGHGYLRSTGVEGELRDAIGTVLYGGTSDIQRVIIARLLGL